MMGNNLKQRQKVSRRQSPAKKKKKERLLKLKRNSNRKPKKAEPTDPEIKAKRMIKLREIAGLSVMALSILAGLSLLSFRQGGENMIGPVGRAIAHGLLYSLGASSFTVALALFVFSLVIFGGGKLRVKPVESMGFFSLVFFGSIQFHLLIPEGRLMGHPPGGLVGTAVGKFLETYFSGPGSVILVTLLLLLSLIMTTGLSVGTVVNKIVSVGSKFLSVTWSLIREGFVSCGRALQQFIDEGREAWDEYRLERREAAEIRRQEILALREHRIAERKARIAEMEAEACVISANFSNPGLLSAPKIDVAEEEAFFASLYPENIDEEINEGPKIYVHSEPSAAQEEPVIELGGSAPAVSVADEDIIEENLQSDYDNTVPGESPVEGCGDGDDDNSQPLIVDMAEENSMRHRQHKPRLPKPSHGKFRLPSSELLDYHGSDEDNPDEQLNREALAEQLRKNAEKLTETLKSYGVTGKVKEIRRGPVVTVYEYLPDAGVKSSKVTNLANDLALQLSVHSVRVVPNIPGKGVMGIEVPNDSREVVSFREVLESEEFSNSRSKLTLGLGKNIEGIPYVVDLAKMPHLLLAGATGMGKSVSINTMLTSILCNATPDEVRLLLIDPKVVEFQIFEDIPHLLHPVINDPNKASLALMWAVEEMERRYRMIADEKQRDLQGYNRKMSRRLKEIEEKVANGEMEEPLEKPDLLPQIVIVIDEFAELMMVAQREVETCIARLAQKARAAGIHLILATQRPSTDVITGVIKANLPTRISCKVASDYDSKTILGSSGAEHLLGRGDMLIKTNDIIRIQGALVAEDEIEKIAEYWKEQAQPEYDESVLQPAAADEGDRANADDMPEETLYDEAVRVVLDAGQVSISMVQRRLRIGYQRAARIVEYMEMQGLVSGPNSQGQRELLKQAA